MGEQPIATLFTVDLDETVAPTAAGETPLYGLQPGHYNLHFEGGSGAWTYSRAQQSYAVVDGIAPGHVNSGRVTFVASTISRSDSRVRRRVRPHGRTR
jgi:N-acetylglucosamine-6-phosphate deacetylase